MLMGFQFIAFEGIDGCGKATQVDELARAIRKKRQPFVIHKYPTTSAQSVHEHLNGKHKLEPDALFAAFVDDLAASQPLLEQDRKKAWVLSDRYVISTAAYQGVGGRLEERVKQLASRPWIKPDLVIWLDLPVEEAMRRKAAQKKPDVHEADRAFLESVRKNFDALYRMRFLCAEWRRIDATQKPEKIAAEIRSAVETGPLSSINL